MEKICRFCGGKMPEGATKCMHCGEWLEDKYRWTGKTIKPSIIKRNVFCTHCHNKVIPKTITPGNIIIELFLYACFIIPGIFYTIWRKTNQYCVCPKCGSKKINNL